MSKRAATYDRTGARTQATVAAGWARRAIQAYNRAVRLGRNSTKAVDAVMDGECHRGEAIEHAGLVCDYGRTVAKVQKQLDAAREKAWRAVL